MKFCPECGAKVEGMKFCPECGYKLTPHSSEAYKNNGSEHIVDNDEKIVLTFQNKALVGDINAKKNIVGNLDIKVPHKDYILTSYGLIIEEHGMLKSKREEIDLYRIDDVIVNQRLIEKARNVGTIKIVSTDSATPNYLLESIENPQKIADLIKSLARKARERLNISYRQNI
ncbi:PH domain-containing protein [Ihubacter massiliensis]|uniref:PH domain-containing protein n=1 Tax=Ihubacter massiliensis TaxID=1852367 RepID=UPI002097BA04|nr:PH domain-containing protein [Ihubacter massiliensis]MCO7122064.1 PH domain-containing protein [Ihubacter massiliensis]